MSVNNDEKNHPQYQRIIRLGGEDNAQSIHAFNAYLDLCEVRQWWNVKVHYQSSLSVVFLSGHPTRHEVRQIVLPVHSEDVVSPQRLQEILRDIKLEGHSTSGVTLAVLDSDSTLVYYKISDGLVSPENPEVSDAKKQQRSMRFRNRQSHVQVAVNKYADMKARSQQSDEKTSEERTDSTEVNFSMESAEKDLIKVEQESDDEEEDYADEL